MSETDRIVGMLTAFALSVGGAVFLMNRIKKHITPDAYHKCRYVKHRLIDHTGSCCCQKVQFTLEAPMILDAYDCESKIRYPHICIPPNAFNVNIGSQNLGVFTLETNGQKTDCYFCSSCGVHVYRILNNIICHVNVDLVDKSTVENVLVSHYDGSLKASSMMTSFLQHQSNITDSKSTSSSPLRSPTPISSAKNSRGGDDIPTKGSPPFKSTSNHQSSHSTNILAVQIYGAFADLNRERESTNQSKNHSDSHQIYELQNSASNTPEKPNNSRKQASSKQSPPSSSSSSSSTSASSVNNSRTVSPSAFSSGATNDRSNYSQPSLEQLRKLASTNK